MTSGRRSVAVAATGVALFALLHLLPFTGGRGQAMDEGAVVSYASRVLDGAVPHRDFLTFYGPGNVWLVAGAFLVFGESVEVERGVGMLYRLLIVLALFALALRLGGLVGAVLGGVVATSFLAWELVWAYATYGALAFGLVALALAAWSSAAQGRSQRIGLALAGLAGGASMLVRFDFTPAVVLGVLPLLTLVPSRTRWWFGAGLLGPLAVYAAHLVVVGPERISRVLGDLLASGPGRSLPIPRPWIYPGNLLAISVLVLLAFLVFGALRWRTRTDEPRARLLVGIALFGLALLPYALSRPEMFHVRPVALVPLSLFPAFGLYVSRQLVPRTRAAGVALSAGVAVLTLVAVLDTGVVSRDRIRDPRGVRDAYHGFLDDHNREAVTAVVAETRRRSQPGDSLFVGPLDLRRTNYGPTYVYFLLRELEPASYYMEMNPGTANREGSGLADELRRADWLILTSEWDDWDEPNESLDFGSAEPNEVVRDDFCLRLRRGEYRLYERCDRAA